VDDNAVAATTVIEEAVQQASVVALEIIAEDTHMSECSEKPDISKIIDIQSTVSVKDNLSELSAGVKMVALTDMAALNKLKDLE
jgi:hypothetical protein